MAQMLLCWKQLQTREKNLFSRLFLTHILTPKLPSYITLVSVKISKLEFLSLVHFHHLGVLFDGPVLSTQVSSWSVVCGLFLSPRGAHGVPVVTSLLACVLSDQQSFFIVSPGTNDNALGSVSGNVDENWDSNLELWQLFFFNWWLRILRRPTWQHSREFK